MLWIIVLISVGPKKQMIQVIVFRILRPIIIKFSDVFILGNPSNDKNGCPAYPWVTTANKGNFTIPTGFTRPISVKFPVFSTNVDADTLKVTCQFFICVDGHQRYE